VNLSEHELMSLLNLVNFMKFSDSLVNFCGFRDFNDSLDYMFMLRLSSFVNACLRLYY
jgi:hypothetical protein